MSYTWSTGAATVLAHVEEDWAGVWSLLFAAAKATFRLSLQVAPAAGGELADAAMDICEARDEVGWVHPEALATALAVDLGPTGPADDLIATCAAIVALVDGALDRLRGLQLAAVAAGEDDWTRRVMTKARAARDVLAEVRS